MFVGVFVAPPRPAARLFLTPICVLALLLCRLQVCRCYNDERGSLGCVWAGSDERGDVILGVCCVWRPRFLVGEHY